VPAHTGGRWGEEWVRGGKWVRKDTASLFFSESMVYHIPRDGGLYLYSGNRRSGVAAQSTPYDMVRPAYC